METRQMNLSDNMENQDERQAAIRREDIERSLIDEARQDAAFLATITHDQAQWFTYWHEDRSFILREVMMELGEQGVKLPDELEQDVRRFISELRNLAYKPDYKFWSRVWQKEHK